MPTTSHRWYLDNTIEDLGRDHRLYLFLTPVPLILGVSLLIGTSLLKVSPEENTQLANLWPVLIAGGSTLVTSTLLVPLKMARKCKAALRQWRAQSLLYSETCESDPVDPEACAERKKTIEQLMFPKDNPT